MVALSLFVRAAQSMSSLVKNKKILVKARTE